MTNEEFQAHLEWVKGAFETGQVQGFHGGRWVDLNGSSSTGMRFADKFRIKPQPREFWVLPKAVREFRHDPLRLSYEAVDSKVDGAIRVREVIE